MRPWLTARMNCLCTCCKRKRKPPGGFIIEDRVASRPRRTEFAAPGRRGIACLVGAVWLGGDASVLPVVLELCFSPAVRAAHKYGSEGEQGPGGGGRVLLSHHSCIIRRTACLRVSTHLVCALQPRWPALLLWMHLFFLHSEWCD